MRPLAEICRNHELITDCPVYGSFFPCPFQEISCTKITQSQWAKHLKKDQELKEYLEEKYKA